MDVKKRIEGICEIRNTRYSDFRHTIYYYSFLDLISSGKDKISDEDIIENAKIYSMTILERNKNIDSEDFNLFKEILESSNEATIELAMSIIALVDNIEYFPHSAIELLHNMVKYSNPEDYEHFYDRLIANLELWSTNSGKEKWKVPLKKELIKNPSISSSDYGQYMSALERAPKPQYTDFATAVSPFVKAPSYAKDINRMGVLCVSDDNKYDILDPDSDEVKYTLSSGAEEAGLRPKLEYSSKNPPKNKGYDAIYPKTTEFGYWPVRAVSLKKQIELDNDLNKKRLVGTLTTGLFFRDGEIKREKSNCYEYNGEIYILVSARFINRLGGYVKFSNNQDYIHGNNIWIKFEPLKCYVDEGSKSIITSDIIMSGIDIGLQERYFDNFFSEEIHQFDVFYQCKRRHLEPKPIALSPDRIRLIEEIKRIQDNPEPVIESKEKAGNKNEEKTSTDDNDNRLDEVIDKYIAFNRENIEMSMLDDYVALFKEIIEQLSHQENISVDTINSLNSLIQPLDSLTDPTKRINQIWNGVGAAGTIVTKQAARQTADKLIPLTDQIVSVLCQEYRTEHNVPVITGVDEIKKARDRYESLLSSIRNSFAINEDSYELVDLLKGIINLCIKYIDSTELKEKLLNAPKILEDLLNVNTRLKFIIDSKNNGSNLVAENQKFIENAVVIYNLVNPTLDVIYDIENIRVEPIAQSTNNPGIFGSVVTLFNGINPFAAKAPKRPEDTRSVQNDNDNANNIHKSKSTSDITIQEANVEDALSILALYSGDSKQNDLNDLRKLLESTEYSFDMGSIGDLVFIVLNSQIDDTTHVYTNRPEMGDFVFSLDDITLTYQNNYWQGDKKHTIEVSKKDVFPTKKQVQYSVKSYANPNNITIIHEDKYDEIRKTFSIEDEEGVSMLSFDERKDKSDNIKSFMRAGMSNETIKAIQGYINELVPSEIINILELYSKNIAMKVHFNDRIFEDF